ncbi:reverse transcriptase-like protein [Sporolactobacillus shoreae]|uniref:Reverse transcriptase-like protein n=1 Tax=Sporolactobacillus shoreae TaxID=1465501 RepID=A0A4Z0GUK9_9BACL|nr:reverse transcriptase-like protein [Sporolactobacillus shoreae]TGB00415.1 reverse transcriptase-like protein [Sporolactobacillus shoreae]
MIEVSFDGASVGNPGLAGGGIYINLGNGNEIRESFPLGTLLSNHEAEFAALVRALQFCHEKGYRNVSFRTDSQLVNQAIEKRYVKKAEFSHYLSAALALIDQFNLFFCKWIPDVKNKNADSLARLAIRSQQKPGKSECDPL